jgi:hypothetical protein
MTHLANLPLRILFTAGAGALALLWSGDVPVNGPMSLISTADELRRRRSAHDTSCRRVWRGRRGCDRCRSRLRSGCQRMGSTRDRMLR